MESELDDAALVARFEDTTLPALSHRDHVRLVFLYAREGGAYERVCDGLIAYTAARGSSGAFHETRTWAWAQLVVAAADGFPGDFDAFWAANPQFERRDLLADHYSDELLRSEAARATVLEPDLRAL
jgi:hypothetical protein